MTLLPQIRNQLDSAARRQATRPGRAWTARITNATLLTRFPSLSGVITAIAVIVALGIGAGAIALLSHHKTATGRHRDSTATAPFSRRTPSASTLLPTRIRRLQGRPIVITVWAAWCLPCRTELSLAATIASHYGHKVAFIASDYLDTNRLARAYLRQHHITLSNYPTGDLHPLVPAHILGVPITIFVKADGRVTQIHPAQYPSASALEHAVTISALSGTRKSFSGQLINHFAVLRRPAIAAPNEAPTSPGPRGGVAVSRYIPINGSAGVWFAAGTSQACLDWPLAASAAPQTDAGGCNSDLADVEAGGLFGEATNTSGSGGAMFIDVVPDGTRTVTITLTNGHIESLTPHNNLVSVPEPSAHVPPFKTLRIESDSGKVSTWCRTCKSNPYQQKPTHRG
jgi:thiol-disulfide isomerase/thioredoxin